ncbi:MAG: prepilin-type N-terminal cleavage/methylation domain-containing protein [Kiritimatiellia bacterium]|jgi:prepilin-type N-terminal cleavage/methylation domain-containing protein|nr:prepilin-type N-terminal cleavage/methylation domain-containing protein [Kiritimatiellia bacterium]
MRSVLPTPNSSLPTPPSGAIKRRQAFTLIEMIIVIAIISSLLALLYGALERAQKFSRRTITYTELKNIESAFKQYHAHYHAWPTNSLDASQIESGEDRGFVINREIARALQGVFDNDTYRDLNPEAIPFIEFSRFSPASGYPANPFKATGNSAADTTRAYKVLFDTNGDRQIEIPGSDPDASALPRTNIIASVAVWTLIPGTRTSDSSGNTEKQQDVLFGSWDSFSVK